MLVGPSGGQLRDTGTRDEQVGLAATAVTWSRPEAGGLEGRDRGQVPAAAGKREGGVRRWTGHSQVPLAVTGEHLLLNSDAGPLLFLQELRGWLPHTTRAENPRGLGPRCLERPSRWLETDKEEEEAIRGRQSGWVCGAYGPFSWRGWFPPQVCRGARSPGGTYQVRWHLT